MLDMTEYTPDIDCCNPAFVLAPKKEQGWLHDSECPNLPGQRVQVEVGKCPFHGDDLFECRGCIRWSEIDWEERGEEW